MDACERYLAVFDENKRKKLDRVPTFVQYIKRGFYTQNKSVLKGNFNGKMETPKRQSLFFNIPFYYFKTAYNLGFDSIFAAYPPIVYIKKIEVENKEGKKVLIGESGQPKAKGTSFYPGGLVHSIDTLDRMRENMKVLNLRFLIKKMLKEYEKMSPYLFPVIQVPGIFDRAWQAMGMSKFSLHFRKKTKLYQELIKFYADICRINVEKIIEITRKTDKIKVINILDDVAFKGRPMIPPERWEEDFHSYYKEINKIISDAGMISQIHTDGDITQLIPSLQKMGFRGLQGWEGGCDPYYINDNFPDFVVIGFGDVSDILPYGTPEKVDSHVKELMDVLKKNRHFIIGPSTVIFKEIPFNNALKFISSVKKYGRY
ncbi:MAG: hypothetical protein GY870_07380 [archaeon]|nr:hypothetical protein [archaeon]